MPEALLDAEDQAFIDAVCGLHQQIEALKIVFAEGRLHTALEAMQKANGMLAAAAVKSVR